MIKGIDVSHHNDLGQLLTKIKPNDRKFIIIKATEGKTWHDPNCTLNTAMAKAETDLIGFYHYARPELNNPIEEAENFLNSQCVADNIGKAILALDWEGEALHCPLSWALRWLRHVYKETGVKPLFYCSAWYTIKLDALMSEGYGLWVAHHTGLSKPFIGKYPFWAIWQYSSTGYDHDKFNGTAQQFRKYMKVNN